MAVVIQAWTQHRSAPHTFPFATQTIERKLEHRIVPWFWYTLDKCREVQSVRASAILTLLLSNMRCSVQARVIDKMTSQKSTVPNKTDFTEMLNCYFHFHLHEVLVPQLDGFRRNALDTAEDSDVYLFRSINQPRKSIAAHLKCLGRNYATSLPNACRRAQSRHACAQRHSRRQLRLFLGGIQPYIVSNNSLTVDLEETKA